MNQYVKRIIETLAKGESIISREPGNSMLPILKSRQPVRLSPITWDKVKKGDIVFCKVRGNYYTHKCYGIDPEKGCIIGNNSGHINGKTKQVFGIVTEILSMDYKGD